MMEAAAFVCYYNGGNVSKRFSREFLFFVLNSSLINHHVLWEQSSRKRLAITSRAMADQLMQINRQVYWPNGELFQCKIVSNTNYRDNNHLDQRHPRHYRQYIDSTRRGSLHHQRRWCGIDNLANLKKWKQQNQHERPQHYRRRRCFSTLEPHSIVVAENCASILSKQQPQEQVVDEMKKETVNENAIEDPSDTMVEQLPKTHKTATSTLDFDWYTDAFVDVQLYEDEDDEQDDINKNTMETKEIEIMV
ncbi:lef-6 [Sucra jujuba nucleopolyhedrovirus]|uniref:Lef-6 n=1 Tax=Sucra jujuba nucleopolyhedrovirus TaxID=1563660 RepID=A0A097P8U6_9ABAC|nr:lef-6 [Sucra jujuba nucleopolyhedrovirus]AIU41251.1 lef-6 [Sucra jujuba nucleopolyhedrovirus]